MRSVKKTAIGVITSVLLFSAINTGDIAYAKQHPQTVRVGMYYSLPGRDSRLFSSHNSSESGFEIGFCDGESFVELFRLDYKAFVVAPSGNLYAKSADSKLLHSGTGGALNFGGYHIQLKGSYSGYSAAYTAAAKKDNAFVAFSGGAFVVRVGMFSSYSEATSALSSYPGGTVHSPASDGITLCDIKSGRILFEYDSNNKSLALRAQKNKAVTLPIASGSGNTFYSFYGFFEYSVNGGKLNMVNSIDLERYVKGVMANEVGLNASDEVTKAFSILIRTVPLRATKHAEYGFDVCNQSCCQVYRGTHRNNERLDSIVDSTKGIILTYEGSPISCQYNYSNGGASCSSIAAWGSSSLPYLTSVFLEEPESEAVVWKEIYSGNELYEFLKSNPSFSSLRGGISDIKIMDTDPLGSDYVTALAVTDEYSNTVTLYNSSVIRGALELNSSNFIIGYALKSSVRNTTGTDTSYSVSVATANGIESISRIGETYRVLSARDDTGEITADYILFDGKGRGHGVGYSQVGAERLIDEGYDYAYTLSFFFPGTVLTDIYK